MDDFSLNKNQKRALLEIARNSIVNAVKTRSPENLSIQDTILNTSCGAFVTIHKNNTLRGCIGNILASMPLWETVQTMALEAALHDPRFPVVSEEELDVIDIEISVLSPLKRIEEIGDIKVGKHGIFIKMGFHQGLLLPQVANEYGWSREQFLENTCMKAGLNINCYKKKDCEIYIFSAIVFGEKD